MTSFCILDLSCHVIPLNSPRSHPRHFHHVHKIDPACASPTGSLCSLHRRRDTAILLVGRPFSFAAAVRGDPSAPMSSPPPLPHRIEPPPPSTARVVTSSSSRSLPHDLTERQSRGGELRSASPLTPLWPTHVVRRSRSSRNGPRGWVAVRPSSGSDE